ncbi:MAG: GHKL domain-containing protein [Lachnospiraceae bacterium]|nr:GHKL domain-containing protein [Lachnospiraceae bacterium]
MLAFLTVFLALLLILLLAAGFYWLPRYIDKKTEGFQSDLVDRHYAEVENMYRVMRSWRHDYHNHIQAAISYAELGKYRELISYLEQLDESLYKIDQIVRTGNLMVDAILNSKLSLMRDGSIRTDVDAHVPSKMKITDPELCVLLGNLLDNAIEACGRLPQAEDRFIKIYMDTLQNRFYISILNSMDGQAKKHGNIFRSTKPAGEFHGFGLQRVDRIVRKYDGFLDRQSEEGVFATEILLPID